MTLQELWMIISRRWKLVVAVTLACIIACGGYFMVAKRGVVNYSAAAYIVANSQVSHVSGLAADEARKLAATPEGAGVVVKAVADTKTMTVTIVANGSDPDACVRAANSVAEAANAIAEKAYSDWDTPYSGLVTTADSISSTTSSNLMKYLLVALVAGLFVSICIIVAHDMMRRPVKTPEGAQGAVDLPVLEMLPAKNGDRLLANVRFASTERDQADGKEIATVLVVPSDDEEAADAASELLRAASDAEHSVLDVRQSDSLSKGIAAAYQARDVDAVVVAVRQWKDTLPQLESTVAELRLSGANLVGIVFAKGKLN